ncbi:cyclic nucleotide-binding domain protein, partial [Vibrio parahaemolyticus V-223/04]
IMGCLKSWRVI